MVVQVAAAIIEADGRFLVTRRKEGTHLAGFWEFPGGKREVGESLEQCLRRELREELEVEIAAPRIFQVVRHAYPDKTVELHFFRCLIESGPPRAVGCAEYRWVDGSELGSLEFPPADQELIRRLHPSDETP